MPSSSCSSSSSHYSSDSSDDDDDQRNARLSPRWSKYRDLILAKGFRLDTVGDVREYYRRHGIDAPLYACDDSALCRDPGLPEYLFRATSCLVGTRLMLKAVHRSSREVQTVRLMASSPLRHDPMNHCIPVLDIIDVPADNICFIVMEEWSSHLLHEIPYRLRDFLSLIRQCIQHIVFMHRNHIVHLDISLYNFLVDYHGNCACIDYELTQRVDDLAPHRCRGTELPPELENGQSCNLYMVDVWALGMLILRACKLADLYIPELLYLVKPMLNHNPRNRPPAAAVLREFERLVCLIEEERLDGPC